MSRALPPITTGIFTVPGLTPIRKLTQSGPRSPPCSPVEGAEEFAIHDYEGFEGVNISGYAGIDSVARIAAFITEHGKLGAGVLKQFSSSIEEAEAVMRDCYLGQFSSLADCMEELTTECVIIPEPPRNYIDWEAMARDAELNGDVFTIETAFDEVHVFSSR
jgi:antirestriction protein